MAIKHFRYICMYFFCFLVSSKYKKGKKTTNHINNNELIMPIIIYSKKILTSNYFVVFCLFHLLTR